MGLSYLGLGPARSRRGHEGRGLKPALDGTMIDIDPRLYLPEDYLVTWSCPECRLSVEIKLAQLDSASCPTCQEHLSADDKKSLEAFRRMIA
jgi:hypothetical protein